MRFLICPQLKSQKGQAMLETALTFPLYFLVTIAAVQFSATTYRYQAIYYAADKAARVLAVTGVDSKAITEAKNVMTALGVPLEGDPTVTYTASDPNDPGLQPARVNVSTRNPSILALLSSRLSILTVSGAAYPNSFVQ